MDRGGVYTYEVEIRRVLVVEASEPYQAVHFALAREIFDLTEDDVHEVRERVPQPAYLSVRIVADAWLEAKDAEGEGLGYPVNEREARS